MGCLWWGHSEEAGPTGAGKTADCILLLWPGALLLLGKSSKGQRVERKAQVAAAGAGLAVSVVPDWLGSVRSVGSRHHCLAQVP